MIKFLSRDSALRICPSCHADFADSVATCSHDGADLISVLDPGIILREKYQIHSLLGFGGMAAVYRARHIHFDEECAVKVLYRPVGKGYLAEAQIARRLRHPNIVRVEDVDVSEDKKPFVVMELVSGGSLRKYLGD